MVAVSEHVTITASTYFSINVNKEELVVEIISSNNHLGRNSLLRFCFFDQLAFRIPNSALVRYVTNQRNTMLVCG